MTQINHGDRFFFQQIIEQWEKKLTQNARSTLLSEAAKMLVCVKYVFAILA